MVNFCGYIKCIEDNELQVKCWPKTGQSIKKPIKKIDKKCPTQLQITLTKQHFGNSKFTGC